MMVDEILFLLATYWPYLAASLAIGVIAGWFSTDPSSEDAGH